MNNLTVSDIGPVRLQAQHIAQADFTDPAEAVRHMLAMQAQDYAGGLWAIGLRTADCSRAAVEQAIVERKIVRTWPMRGTLHFLHADDVRWMLTLTAMRATAAAKNRRLALGLTDRVMDEAEAVVRQALSGGKALRRDDLRTLLMEHVRGMQIGNMQTQHIYRNFGERGIICFGPHNGKQPTFVLLDEWLPDCGRTMERDEALGELARRYFTAHGPATLQDLAGWSFLTMTDVKRGLELARFVLSELVVNGKTYYLAANAPVPSKGHSTFLLPGFDEYILGYKDRSAVLPAEHAGKIVPGNNGMFLPTIVVDGQIVGTWKRGLSTLTDHFAVPKTDDRQIGKCIQRYQAFLQA